MSRIVSCSKSAWFVLMMSSDIQNWRENTFKINKYSKIKYKSDSLSAH